MRWKLFNQAGFLETYPLPLGHAPKRLGLAYTQRISALSASDQWIPIMPPPKPIVNPLKVRHPRLPTLNKLMARPRISAGEYICASVRVIELNERSRNPAHDKRTNARMKLSETAKPKIVSAQSPPRIKDVRVFAGSILPASNTIPAIMAPAALAASRRL